MLKPGKDSAMAEKKVQPTTVDDYIAQFPEDVQQILVKLRAEIQEAAPQAEERITYQMPGYYLNGLLVSFAVWKHHIGLYPRTSGMQAIPGLAAYKGSKGSLHFPLDEPMPYELIRKIVEVRIAENLQAE